MGTSLDPHPFLQNLEVWALVRSRPSDKGEEGRKDIRPLHSELLWLLHWMQLTLPSSAGRP